MTPILIEAGAGIAGGGVVVEGGAEVAGGGAAVVEGGAGGVVVLTGGAAVVVGAGVDGEEGADEQLARIRLEINRTPSMTQRILFTELPPYKYFSFTFKSQTLNRYIFTFRVY